MTVGGKGSNHAAETIRIAPKVPPKDGFAPVRIERGMKEARGEATPGVESDTAIKMTDNLGRHSLGCPQALPLLFWRGPRLYTVSPSAT